jgi:hypothetical protein
MTPTSPADPSLPETSRAQSGLVNVFRNLGLRNRSGFSNPSAPTTPASSNATRSTSQFEFFPDIPGSGGQDFLERLRRDKPFSERVASAEALRAIVADVPSHVVTDIWYNAQDLVGDEHPAEARQAGFKLLTACLKSLNELTPLDRLRYYRTIAQHEHYDDFDDQLQALRVLTSGGRNLSAFEREIAGLLSKWLKILFFESGNARQLRKRDGRSPECLSGAEFCLRELFKFVTDIIKFNFQSFEEQEISQLLADVLSISRKTTDKKDIECSIVFIETLITFGYIPPDSLRSCIEILCGTHCTIRDLAEDTWNAISNLCRSYMANNCVHILLDIPRKPLKKGLQSPNTNTIRGAIWFLEKLLLEDGQNGLPKVQISMIMSCFRDVLARNNPRLEMGVCGAISRVLARPDIVSQISFDEWSLPLELLVRISRRTTERADGVSLEHLGVKNVPKPRSRDKDVNTAISQSLFQIINQLEEACRQPDFTDVEGVVEFLLDVHGHIPDSAAEFVLNHYAAEHLCYPSCGEWLRNAQRLVDAFFKSGQRPSELRVQVLSIIKDVYETIREVCDQPLLHELVMIVFDNSCTEPDPKVLDALVKIIIDVAGDSNMELFDQLLGTLINYSSAIPQATNNRNSLLTQASATSSSYGSSTNIVTRGLVKIFIRNLHSDAIKAAKAYEEIVKIAGSSICEDDARLTAMRLLFRLRADSENRVFIVDCTESDYLAGVLGRSAKSLDELDGQFISHSTRYEEFLS